VPTTAGGTVEKALFKIVCTTCRARLAVRAEAAIGAILECPKCASMVHITPPEGWQPPPPPGEASPSDMPPDLPPLDHVAQSLAVDLEPARGAFVSSLLHHKWLFWGVAPPVLTLTVVVVLLWLSRSQPKPVAIPSASPASAVAEAIVDQPSIPKAADVQNVDRPATTEPTSAPPVTAAVDSNVATPADKSSEQSASQATAAESALVAAAEPAHSPAVKTDEPNTSPSAAEKATEDTVEGTQSVEIKRLPLPRVDFAVRLADTVADIQLTEMPLVAAMDVLAAMSTLPITLDPDAMEKLGVAPRDPISLHLTSVSMGKLLRAVAAQRGLAANVDNGQVLVTAPAEYRETLRKARYSVSDLTGDDKKAAVELAAAMRKLVAPESWQGHGGRGTIEADADALSVLQSDDGHQQVLVFCEKLRNARQKPLRSRDNAQRFTLVTHLDQAKEMLVRPVTANFRQPAPLATVLTFLAGIAKSDILVDRVALAAVDTSDRVEASLTVQKEKLGVALAELLRPLGLTYRAIGPNTLQVTTREAAEEHMDLEFYPVGAWLAKGTSGPALIEQLKTQAPASTWSESGGAGEIYFDSPSQHVVVLQSQPVQATIEQFLTNK
jgi:hypothetical protein